MISVTAKASVPNTESSIEKNKMPAIIKKKDVHRGPHPFGQRRPVAGQSRSTATAQIVIRVASNNVSVPAGIMLAAALAAPKIEPDDNRPDRDIAERCCNTRPSEKQRRGNDPDASHDI